MQQGCRDAELSEKLQNERRGVAEFSFIAYSILFHLFDVFLSVSLKRGYQSALSPSRKARDCQANPWNDICEWVRSQSSNMADIVQSLASQNQVLALRSFSYHFAGKCTLRSA